MVFPVSFWSRHLGHFGLVVQHEDFPALLRTMVGILVVFERGELALRFLGVRAVHHLRVLPEHALGIALRVAVVGRALGPGVAIAALSQLEPQKRYFRGGGEQKPQ